MIAEANKGGQPDVYFVSGYPPTLDILREQLKELGARKVASIVAPSISDRPELFEGDWYTDSDLAHDEFKTRFEQKYPNTRFATHMMPYAYDSFNILVQAFESGKDPVEYVRGVTSYKGEAGEITKEPESGDFRSRPAVSCRHRRGNVAPWPARTAVPRCHRDARAWCRRAPLRS